MPKYITDDMEISSDYSDKEDSNEESSDDSNKENSNEKRNFEKAISISVGVFLDKTIINLNNLLNTIL